MRFLEKNLEDIIFDTDGEKLMERGFCYVPKIRKRQLKIGNYGILDMVTIDRVRDPFSDYLDITVYEFKKDQVNIDSFIQAVRYVRGIQRYMEKRGNINYSINIILAGNSISSDILYLPELTLNQGNCAYGGIETIGLYTYDYDFDGISFKSHTGYKLIDEGFE